MRSPSQTSPVSAHPSRSYWDSRPAQPAQLQPRSPRAVPPSLRSASGDRGNYWPNPVDSPPETARPPRVAPPTFTGSSRGSESPHLATQRPIDPTADYKDRRRRGTRDKEMEVATSPGDDAPKRDRKRRSNVKQRNERGRTETPKPYGGPPNQNPPFKVNYLKRDESAGPSSSAGSGSQSRSAQPSPTSTVPTAPPRPIDEDYDEGVAETLIGLASYRAPEQTPAFANGPATSNIRPISPSPSMRSKSHRGSISSTRSRASPPPSSVGTTAKRPLSPVPDDIDPKRTKVDIPTHRGSPPATASSRPSPVPFRTQPSSHSPENRQTEKSKHPSYPSSPQLPAVLPLPPRPIGAGLSHTSNTLPPIATLSPTSTSPSPAHEPERMSIDRTQSRSASPQTQVAPRNKFAEVMNPTEQSNTAEPS
jgi:glucose repression mediator protein